MSKPRVLGLIPARGGSKGVPGKNIIEVAGLPLIAWTILAAQSSKYIDRLIVSSDDSDIIKVARNYRCEAPFQRPAELASDEASSADVVLHALHTLEDKYDLLVLLQPTSPLRTTADIDNSVQLLLETGAPSVMSICQADKSPFWMYSRNNDGVLKPFIEHKNRPEQRQGLPPVYFPNGAIYVVRCDQFCDQPRFVYPQTRGYLMPRIRSLDIDTQDDLDWLEWQCACNPEIIPNPSPE